MAIAHALSYIYIYILVFSSFMKKNVVTLELKFIMILTNGAQIT